MGTPEDVQKLYGRLNFEIKTILNNVIQMVYFMRGGVGYDHALYGMSYIERDQMNEYINSRLEKEAKSSNPNY